MDKNLYKNLWMSPNVALIRMEKIINRCGGVEKMRSNSKFKPEREAWVAAIFLLGLRQIEKQELWLEIVVDEETPDIYGYRIREVDGNNHRDVLNIEIADFEEHSGSVMDIIRKKTSKSYPPYFTLLIYGRKMGASVNLSALTKEVSKIVIPFADVWLLLPSSLKDDYYLARLYPEKGVVKFNLREAFNANKQQRDFGTFLKRGTGTGTKCLGIKDLPLPECK